jgi:hypothetical protein
MPLIKESKTVRVDRDEYQALQNVVSIIRHNYLKWHEVAAAQTVANNPLDDDIEELDAL